MTCKNCKHTLGPEDLRCPKCGAENPFALQHAQNMQQHEAEFSKTEKEVEAATISIKEIGTRAVIIIALLIGSIVMYMISIHNYADPHPEEAVQKDAVKNASAYADEMDVYLRDGDYMEFINFVYGHDIQFVNADAYDRFYYIQPVAKDYYECIKHLEYMILRSDDPDYFDSLNTNISNFCMYFDSFCETTKNAKTREKNEEYKKYVTDMEEEIRCALKEYCSMDDEAFETFTGMSRAKKAVELERILRHE